MKVVVRAIIAISMFLSTQILVAQGKLDFKPLTNMNSDRYGMGYTSDGKNIYAVCGGTSDLKAISNSIESYSIENNKWTTILGGITFRRYCNAEYIPAENKIYIINGENFISNKPSLIENVEVIDLKTKQISAGSENPYPVRNAGSVVWKNKIYLFGGRSHYNYSDRLYEYDPVKNTWERLPDMPEAKETRGKIIDGVLYIFGGYDGIEKRSIDAYNIGDSTWSHIGTLPSGVSAHAVASDSRNIWLVGSYNNLKYLSVYDTKSKTLTAIESNMVERRHSGAQIIGEKLYVFGGNQNEENISTLSNTECGDISLYKK